MIVADSTKALPRASFRDLMRYERLRVVTYLLYGHEWPKTEAVSPSKLAAAGFYYQAGDTVKCPFCGLTLSDWAAGDDPLAEHRKAQPGCEFFKLAKNVSLEVDPDLNSSTVENSFTSPPEVVSLSITPTHEQLDVPYNLTDTPRFPLFEDIAQRLKTFRKEGWQCPVDGRDFAQAGFFWTGAEDRCRCFHCGGMLFGWKQNEQPMEEHAKFFPQCHFLHRKQGRTYVEYVQFKMQIISLREKLDVGHSAEASMIKKRDIDCMKSMSFENFVAMKNAASAVFDKLERSNNGKASYYKKYAQKFFLLVDCQVLYQHLVSMNVLEPNYTGRGLVSGQERASSPCSDNGYSSDEFGHLSDGSVCSSSSSSTSSQGSSNSGSNSFQCIICCENRIEVVFTPCGHQLACRQCSGKFDHCPVCRTKIQQKIRTYLIS